MKMMYWYDGLKWRWMILAVLSATYAVVNMTRKIQTWQEFKPWPVPFWCSALPIEPSIVYRLVIAPHDDKLQVGLIAQLLGHCIRAAGLNPCSGLNFSAHTHYCLSSTKYCKDHSPSYGHTSATFQDHQDS